MKGFVEKIIDRIISERKTLLKELASEAYAQKLRKHVANPR
jgi:hypothetical protein